jgi:hypothetical protein
MGNNVNERWLSRQELADRYALPVKTLAQWASKGTGPRYARWVDTSDIASATSSTGNLRGSTTYVRPHSLPRQRTTRSNHSRIRPLKKQTRIASGMCHDPHHL